MKKMKIDLALFLLFPYTTYFKIKITTYVSKKKNVTINSYHLDLSKFFLVMRVYLPMKGILVLHDDNHDDDGDDECNQLSFVHLMLS